MKFYTCGRMRYYGERGLLAYLFHELLRDDPRPMLEAARSPDGTTLLSAITEIIGELRGWMVYTELDLGAQGFGCPDGGLLLKGERGNMFVPIEGKAVRFKFSFQDPKVVSAANKDIDWDAVDTADIESLMRQNTYNSSGNGQHELKWRFVNAITHDCFSQARFSVPLR